MVNINKYIKALLHPAGDHQGSHKAHQAGNQSDVMWRDVTWHDDMTWYVFQMPNNQNN